MDRINKLMDYTVVDLEMTGLNVKKDKVIEIGAARVRNGKVVETYETFLNSVSEVPERITKLTGITTEMMQSGVLEDEGMSALIEFIGDDVLVGQNFSFDYKFIRQWAVNHKVAVNNSYLDTLILARKLLPVEQSKRLEELCNYFGIQRENAHRALYDAIETSEVYLKLLELSKEEFVPKEMTMKVKKISPITKAQVEQIEKYRQLHNVTEPIDWGSLNRSEASRLMEYYYQTYGR